MKYIIEINDTPMTTPELGKKLYKAKGFNSLVFDQNGLDKLEKFETTSMIDKSNFSEEQYRLDIENAHSCGYQEGYDTAVENAQATKLDWGEVQYKKGKEDLSHAMLVYEDTSAEERLEYYGTNVWAYQYAIDNPTELIAMAKAYEEKKKAEEDTIKVGDVIYSGMSNVKALVIYISEWGNYHCLHSDGTMFTLNVKEAKYWTKVGHFDEVSQVLDKLLEKD